MSSHDCTRSPDFGQILRSALETVGPLVKSELRRRCPSLVDEDVEDALAQAVANLWRKREQYRTDTKLNGLLYRAALNAAFDILNKKLVNKTLPLRVAIPIEGDSDGEHSISIPLERLRDVLKNLSREDQHIILHWAKNGYSIESDQCSYRWTAPLVDELKMSAGTLRVRRRRILQRIKEVLLEEGVCREANEE